MNTGTGIGNAKGTGTGNGFEYIGSGKGTYIGTGIGKTGGWLEDSSARKNSNMLTFYRNYKDDEIHFQFQTIGKYQLPLKFFK